MLSEKERLIIDIVNDMVDAISEEQMDKLKLSLYKRITPLEVKPAEANLVVYDQPNSKLITMFIMAKKMINLSPNSIHFYETVLLKADKDFHQKPFLQLTTLELQCYLAAIAEKTSPVNSNNTRRILSSFFGWLQDTEYITKNPMKTVQPMKQPKRTRHPFTVTELETLRNAATDIRTRSIIEMLLSTGCRISELVGIKVNDIDWIRGEARVIGKGNKERIVFINETASLYTKQYLSTRTDNNPALYVSMDKPHATLQKGAIEMIVRELGRSCGIKKVFPHRFRHTAATFAMRRGMSVEIVKKMLGHESIDTTMIYAQTDWDSVRAARRIYCE